jgi:hypothetical protein
MTTPTARRKLLNKRKLVESDEVLFIRAAGMR